MLAGAALLTVAAIAAAVLIAPSVQDAKRDDAEAERRRAAQRHAERIAQLRSEMRPRRGRAPGLSADTGSADDPVRRRRALVRHVEAEVLDHARGRVDSGEFRIPVRTVRCEQFPRRAEGPPPEDRPARRTGRYECLALTSRIAASGDRNEGAIGYPFRVRIDFTTGRYGYCKISGRAGEGGLRGQPLVEVPAGCGGD